MQTSWFELQRVVLLLRVSLKYGLGPLIRRLLRRPANGDSLGVRIHHALEELGLTYVKLGQFLALRFDIVPPEIARELNQLFENVPPLPFEVVRTVVEAELGHPVDALFLEFESQPIAAASVAQVHRARTLHGERVAVKIQRPSIERLFAADMRILLRFTAVLDALHVFGRLSVTEMTTEFASWTWREMDFLIEAHTAERVREHTVDEIVPDVHWDLTTSRVLTTDFIEGISLARLAGYVETRQLERIASEYPGLDIDEVLHRLAMASLRQLFLSGLFHGDPHPGNILVQADNQVAFVDFGIFGELTSYERSVLAGLIENLALGNVTDAFHYYALELMATEDTDPRSFERQSKEVLQRWYAKASDPTKPVSERHVGRYIGEMIEVSRRNGLRMGINYLLCWRTLNALDATVLRLQPEFDLMRELRTFFETFRPGLAQRIVDFKRDRQLALAFADLLRDLPPQSGRVLDRLSTGRFLAKSRELESPFARRRQDRHALLLALALVSVALAALAHGAHTLFT